MMELFHDKFLYIKHQVVVKNKTTYAWYFINKNTRQGVHFHGVKYSDDYDNRHLMEPNRYGFQTYGIEAHFKNPLYDNQLPLENCWVTQGDCYCSGSSLSAEEHLGHINPDDDDYYIWLTLHEFYQNWVDYAEEFKEAI